VVSSVKPFDRWVRVEGCNFALKKKVKRLLKATCLVPRESPFSRGRNYIIEVWQFSNSRVTDYLSYVFPKILHNYFQLPFRLTEDLHQFSWNAEETVSNKINIAILESWLVTT
jgi:hypothetical protein